MIVQDKRFHPSSGRVVAYLGNYDPHSKQSNFDKDKLIAYLTNGAQPSPRVIKLLKSQKITLPEWVIEPAPKEKKVRNPDKRRSTRPPEAAEPKTEAPAEETPATEEAKETPSKKAEAEEKVEVEEPEAKIETPEEKTAEPESAANNSAEK
jgi:small subunit ribosomal protein S16